MKRRVVLAAATAVLALVFGGGASARVSFDPTTGVGFIGRGDVNSQVGKAGLVAQPVVVHQATIDWSFDCTVFVDDVRVGAATGVTGQGQSFELYLPTTRYAANGNITGYTLPGFLLDSDTHPRPAGLCLDAIEPLPDGVVGSVTRIEFGNFTQHYTDLGLWFDGVHVAYG